jgi:hypothetical protein
MNQRSVAYQALGAAWDQVLALMLAGRISLKEAQRIKSELDRAGDAIVPDPMEALAMELRSTMFSSAALPHGDVGTGATNEVPPGAPAENARVPGKIDPYTTAEPANVPAMRDRARRLFRWPQWGQGGRVSFRG